jgi:hypothetical protein
MVTPQKSRAGGQLEMRQQLSIFVASGTRLG